MKRGFGIYHHIDAGDVGQVGDAGAEVFRKQVAGEAGIHAFDGTDHVVVSMLQRFVLSGGSDDDAVLRDGGDVGGAVEKVLEGGEAGAELGGDGNGRRDGGTAFNSDG